MEYSSHVKYLGEGFTVTINPLDLVLHLCHEVGRISVSDIGDPNKLLGRPESVDLVNVVIVKCSKCRDIIQHFSAWVVAVQLMEEIRDLWIRVKRTHVRRIARRNHRRKCRCRRVWSM